MLFSLILSIGLVFRVFKVLITEWIVFLASVFTRNSVWFYLRAFSCQVLFWIFILFVDSLANITFGGIFYQCRAITAYAKQFSA